MVRVPPGCGLSQRAHTSELDDGMRVAKRETAPRGHHGWRYAIVRAALSGANQACSLHTVDCSSCRT